MHREMSSSLSLTRVSFSLHFFGIPFSVDRRLVLFPDLFFSSTIATPGQFPIVTIDAFASRVLPRRVPSLPIHRLTTTHEAAETMLQLVALALCHVLKDDLVVVASIFFFLLLSHPAIVVKQ